jgi:Predicted branched-chain amino acid permease (azaleucine resistance)
MKRRAFKVALPYTIPVLMGYLFLGIAFGVLLGSKGYHVGWALLMSVVIYAGSMQFVAINLLVSPFNLIHALIVTLLVQARHLFYGLSMLDKFKISEILKPYMIFALTDETYSLLCSVEPPEGVNKKWFMFFISLLNHSYWVLGSVIGNLAGTFFEFDPTGIDFAMTALFIVIFVEQWEQNRQHTPALLGLGVTLVSLLIFGTENFMVFAMMGIFIALSFRKSRLKEGAGTR